MGLTSSHIIPYEEAVERLGADSSLHEDGFRRICDSKGFIDSSTFYTSFLRSMIPSISTKLADAIFRGFDTRSKNKLDVKDFVCALGVRFFLLSLAFSSCYAHLHKTTGHTTRNDRRTLETSVQDVSDEFEKNNDRSSRYRDLFNGNE